jgi:hypothetical protein
MRLVHTAIKHSDNDKKRDIKNDVILKMQRKIHKIHARMIRFRKELDQLMIDFTV